MTSYWVRPARPADLKAVRELARRVRREFKLGVRANERLAATRPADLLWVVEAGRAEIVGSCGVREGTDAVWELHALYLAPEWRGFGLGRALVEQAVRASQQAGALRLECSVPAEMPEAIALLRSLGFEEEGADASGRPRRFARTLAKAS